MTTYYLIGSMLACCCIYGLAAWKQKHKQIGQVPLVPYYYWQFFAMMGFLILAANLIGHLTGVTWESPFGGRR